MNERMENEVQHVCATLFRYGMASLYITVAVPEEEKVVANHAEELRCRFFFFRLPTISTRPPGCYRAT